MSSDQRPPEPFVRDTLIRLIVNHEGSLGGEYEDEARAELADAILELVPPQSVVLTPEDREAAWQEYRRTHFGLFPDARLDFTAGWDALAALMMSA